MAGNRNNKTKAGPAAKGIRMKELTAATGIPKSAILHYLTQGLLPKPLKTSPNMAYYDPACIERLKFIKELQNTYSIPLSKIKMLLVQKDQRKDLTHLTALDELVFSDLEGPTLDEAEFCAATDLTPALVQELMENGLLLPSGNGKFTEQDAAVGKIYRNIFTLGIKPVDLTFYTIAAKIIVEREMRMLQQLTAHLPETEGAELTKQMIQAVRTVRHYVTDRTFQQRIGGGKQL